MSIAFKEGVKISPPAVDQIINAANHDIRQVRCMTGRVKLSLNTLEKTQCFHGLL